MNFLKHKNNFDKFLKKKNLTIQFGLLTEKTNEKTPDKIYHLI